jgi:hypothetical protein
MLWRIARAVVVKAAHCGRILSARGHGAKLNPVGRVVWELMVVVTRGILLFGCAAAMAVGPLVVAAPAAACPYGTTQTRFDGVCTAGGPGNVAVSPSGPSGNTVVNMPGQVSSINGIPCTPEHYGTCLAMSQSG